MYKGIKKILVVIFTSSLLLTSCGVSGGTPSGRTIVWLNYDNSLIKKDTGIKEGEIPVYRGESPTKPSTEQYCYTFSGWSPEVVPAYIDATYVAQFSASLMKYTVTWEDDDGTLLSTEEYEYGSTPTYKGTVSTKEIGEYTYIFRGWSPTIEKVKGNVTYKVAYRTKAKSYSITYNLDGGTNAPSNPYYYTVDSSFSFVDPSKTGYSFLGWFDENGNKIESITSGTTGNLVINARWTPIKYNLSVTSENTSKGTVTVVSGSGFTNESITIKATPKSNYVLKGWYVDDKRVSKETEYTFSMPNNDYHLVARFITTQEETYENARARAYGTSPIFSSDGKTVTYGLYPQKNVNNSSLIGNLNKLTKTEANGWYLYNGSYYAKLVAKPYSGTRKFDNGDTINTGQTYWFKCEPISWIAITTNDGVRYLSKYLLDAHHFYNKSVDADSGVEVIYACSFSTSGIRTWLNGEFYNSAFALGNSNIQTTNVTNYVSYSPYGGASVYSDKFVSSNNVYLPCFGDLHDDCIVTDWAKARGADYNMYNGIPRGYCWTLSAEDSGVYVEMPNHYLYGYPVSTLYESKYCARPMISIDDN